jgi:hypothetical protein
MTSYRDAEQTLDDHDFAGALESYRAAIAGRFLLDVLGPPAHRL